MEFLKRQPSYEDIFDGLDETQLHRAAIEQRLTLSKYRDFTKLYRFSRISQRKFLDLYFLHYEIAILKRCLRAVLDHRPIDLDLSAFQEFFEKHSRLDLGKLSSCQTVPELLSCLEGSPFYGLLSSLSEHPEATLFDYELKLDLLYFKTMWKASGKLTRQETDILKQCFGSKLDMLNIQWIYRSRKYYQLSPAQIYALLIPIHYKLKQANIVEMAEAETMEQFFAALKATYYGGLSLAELEETPDLDGFYEQVLNRIHRLTSRRNPYSIAALNSFLYFKEQDVRKIITVIEGVRYGLDADVIGSYVIKNHAKEDITHD